MFVSLMQETGVIILSSPSQNILNTEKKLFLSFKRIFENNEIGKLKWGKFSMYG